LQGANRWGEHFYHGPIDGIYGRKSASATRHAKFYLGYPREKVNGGTGDIFGDKLFSYLLPKDQSNYRHLPPDYVVRKKHRAYELLHKDWHRQAIAVSRSQLHETEHPANSNLTKFNTWYYGHPVSAPWCAIFVSWVLHRVNGPSWFKYAYCPFIMNDAQKGLHGMHITSSPRAGDIALYDWDNDGVEDHVEFFVGGNPASTFTALGGNTGPEDKSNGGQVLESQRSRSDVAAFVHLP
jgi:hypothetical protein